MGKPAWDVMSRYSRLVNSPVDGQKCTLLTTFGLTREPESKPYVSDFNSSEKNKKEYNFFFLKKRGLTFGDNALNTDQRSNKLREELSRSDTARDKMTFESDKDLLTFLQVFRVNIAGSFSGCVAKRLHILNWILQYPTQKQKDSTSTQKITVN